MSIPRIRLALIALTGLAAGAITALAVFPLARERLLPRAGMDASGEALIGGPFTLTDQAGRTVSDADFRGRTMLVLFGSTASTGTTGALLQVLSAALQKLGTQAAHAVPILITVDPDRDTPERLLLYSRDLEPRLVALTGTPGQIRAVLDAYRVPVSSRQEDPAAPGGYTIEVPSRIYVMGPDGRYRGHINYTADPDAVAARLADML